MRALEVPCAWISATAFRLRNYVLATLRDALKVKHQFAVPYSPWTNGTCELMVRGVVRILKSILSEERRLVSDGIHVVPALQCPQSCLPCTLREFKLPRSVRLTSPLSIFYADLFFGGPAELSGTGQAVLMAPCESAARHPRRPAPTRPGRYIGAPPEAMPGSRLRRDIELRRWGFCVGPPRHAS